MLKTIIHVEIDNKIYTLRNPHGICLYHCEHPELLVPCESMFLLGADDVHVLAGEPKVGVGVQLLHGRVKVRLADVKDHRGGLQARVAGDGLDGEVQTDGNPPHEAQPGQPLAGRDLSSCMSVRDVRDCMLCTKQS
eukprot:scaffold220899_cov36-Prasinocladus_malaysianus.AAC.1